MLSTLKSLADLLVQAVPTILFFILLTIFLNVVFFKPIAKVLEERRRQTKGARELAQQALAAADQKTSEFEAALAAARSQVYQENEAQRRKWEQERDAELQQLRGETEKQVEAAHAQVEQETQSAQIELERNLHTLSDSIVAALEGRRAA